jgi:uncharacterized protein (DUF952 family)
MKPAILIALVLIITIVIGIYLHKRTHIPHLTLNPEAIYKIVPPAGYNPSRANDCVTLVDLDKKDGFIHTSLGTQAQAILQKFFKGQGHIVLLELDKTVLQQHGLEVRLEQNKPGGTFFPHIYGNQQIPQSAIKAVVHAREQADGTWVNETGK